MLRFLKRCAEKVEILVKMNKAEAKEEIASWKDITDAKNLKYFTDELFQLLE